MQYEAVETRLVPSRIVFRTVEAQSNGHSNRFPAVSAPLAERWYCAVSHAALRLARRGVQPELGLSEDAVMPYFR